MAAKPKTPARPGGESEGRIGIQDVGRRCGEDRSEVCREVVGAGRREEVHVR